MEYVKPNGSNCSGLTVRVEFDSEGAPITGLLDTHSAVTMMTLTNSINTRQTIIAHLECIDLLLPTNTAAKD